MSRKAFRLALAVVVTTLVAVAFAVGFAASEVLRYPERRNPGQGREVAIEIRRGMKLGEVAAALGEARVVDRPTWFRLYAMHRGLAGKVRAGRYVVRDDLSPRELLDILVKGVEEREVSVTIPEGKHIREVFAYVVAAGVVENAEALERVARDPAWLRSQGIEGETVEGYLFPDTYRFKVPTPPEQVLATMVRRHRAVYEELRARHAATLESWKKKLGWTDHHIVTLASIVEKEAASASERPVIASVFYNRLTFPSFPSRRLETDPTIRYGCMLLLRKPKGCVGWTERDRLHRKQLDDADNPYNTYRHAGLPPGPIANPGRASLEATMNPAQTEYLYFVAKDERTHVFSKTFAEHTRWVNLYQK